MALSLPYPSMTFVPLDILTAEEMNQIVANYEYISNQFPIGTGNLNNGAVTSDKLGAGAVTAGKLGTAAVKDENIDWDSIDTGWVDCAYRSGFKTGNNTQWKQLQARVLGNVLYMRGSVSKTSGIFSANSEVFVADLPTTIKNLITSIESPIHAAGRCNNNGGTLWTVAGPGTSEPLGAISVIPFRGVGSDTSNINWLSVGASYGPIK